MLCRTICAASRLELVAVLVACMHVARTTNIKFYVRRHQRPYYGMIQGFVAITFCARNNPWNTFTSFRSSSGITYEECRHLKETVETQQGSINFNVKG